MLQRMRLLQIPTQQPRCLPASFAFVGREDSRCTSLTTPFLQHTAPIVGPSPVLDA